MTVRRPEPRDKDSLPGKFHRGTEDGRRSREEFSSGAHSFGYLAWAARKVTGVRGETPHVNNELLIKKVAGFGDTE